MGLIAAGIGFGISLLFPSLPLTAQALVPQTQVTIAITQVSFRTFGQIVSVSVGRVIFRHRMRVELSYPNQADVAENYSLDALAFVKTLKTLPAHFAETLQLKTAFAKSSHVMWAVMRRLAVVS
ncbi:MFS transporter, putative [Macrophomina phaseolina MS6]|uniref:MFS transporter, putative n=1 Tax=Macrophomina phaseolina (strain MS6) TaxID=1126212 RepID=K2S4I4_MACPH|nr:MFS transporter, putative [Macrophomina phaseolina MS6]